MERFCIYMQSSVENLQKHLWNEAATSKVQRMTSVSFRSVLVLWKRELAEGDRVFDHCHAGGKFLVFGHSECNLKWGTVNYIPIFALNLSNYDLNFICKNQHLSQKKVKYKLFIESMKNTFGLRLVLKLCLIPTVEALENMSLNICFVGFYRFMVSSLDKLVI